MNDRGIAIAELNAANKIKVFCFESLAEVLREVHSDI